MAMIKRGVGQILPDAKDDETLAPDWTDEDEKALEQENRDKAESEDE